MFPRLNTCSILSPIIWKGALIPSPNKHTQNNSLDWSSYTSERISWDNFILMNDQSVSPLVTVVWILITFLLDKYCWCKEKIGFTQSWKSPWILGKVLEKSMNFLQLWMWWPGKCFLVLFGCPRQNINHSSENLKVIYIKCSMFYALINYQFKTSELKNF